jgi:hypothetical protein
LIAPQQRANGADLFGSEHFAPAGRPGLSSKSSANPSQGGRPTVRADTSLSRRET